MGEQHIGEQDTDAMGASLTWQYFKNIFSMDFLSSSFYCHFDLAGYILKINCTFYTLLKILDGSHANVKGVAHNEEPTNKYHQSRQFLSALWRILASFGSLFWFYNVFKLIRLNQNSKVLDHKTKIMVEYGHFLIEGNSRVFQTTQSTESLLSSAALNLDICYYLNHFNI